MTKDYHPPFTGLSLRRAKDYFAIARDTRVLIDEEEVGRVAYGCWGDFPLEPGTYSVTIKMDWCRSASYPIEVKEGEAVELEGSIRCRGFLWMLTLFAMFFLPWRIFVVRPIPSDEGCNHNWREGLCVLASMLFGLLLISVLGLALIILFVEDGY